MKKLLLLPILLALGACSNQPAVIEVANPVAQRAADFTGLQNFDEVREIRFTFHVKKSAEAPEVSRGWIWQPKENRVTLEQEGREPLTFYRHGLAAGTEEERQADKMFINDQYWLLFPLRLAWDEGILMQSEPAVAPGTGEDCDMVRVTYAPEGGYTPGDVYELFVDAGGKTLAWKYYPGGAADPGRVTTWEDYQSFGPLQISLNRPATNGDFRVWFTGVEVETAE